MCKSIVREEGVCFMLKTLTGYVLREELKKLESGEGSTLTVLGERALMFTAFQMRLTSGELVPIQITFNEKEKGGKIKESESQPVTVERGGSPGEAHWRTLFGDGGGSEE